jgi:hypothetical protein
MEETKPTGKTKKTAVIPAKDLDFAAVTKNIATKWASEPWLTLLWTTQNEFATKQTSYDTVLNARQAKGKNRPQITKALKMLDSKIDTSISYVKGYITDKYKKEAAQSYFPSFGIDFINKAYLLPADQNKRSAALKLMVDAIATNGFSDKEFGTTFWTSIKEEYDDLLSQASTIDSNVSSNVSDKNTLKADLKKTLNAIIHSIKANYPDTYKATLRNWGFQKEKY